MCETYKDLSPIVENEEFLQVTGHGGRACLITYSLLHGVTAAAIMQQTRHATVMSMAPYSRQNEEASQVFQDVLAGNYRKKPPTLTPARGGQRKKKKIRTPAVDTTEDEEGSEDEGNEDKKQESEVIVIKDEEKTKSGAVVTVEAKTENKSVANEVLQELREQNTKLMEMLTNSRFQESAGGQMGVGNTTGLVAGSQQHPFAVGPMSGIGTSAVHQQHPVAVAAYPPVPVGAQQLPWGFSYPPGGLWQTQQLNPCSNYGYSAVHVGESMETRKRFEWFSGCSVM